MTEEMIDIFDEQENTIDTVSRSVARLQNLLRRGAGVLVFNSEGKLLIHRRAHSMKQYPDFWDIKVGGFVSSGEDPEKTAYRETEEEIGAKGIVLTFVLKYKYTDAVNNEFSYLYRTVYDGPLVLQKGEVDEAEWVDEKELVTILKERHFVPTVYYLWAIHRELIFKNVSQSFDSFTQLVKKSMKHDPWVPTRGLSGYCDEIRTEAEEAIAAVKNKDYENLKEELGDVLLDWTHACMIAEKEGHFTMDEVIDSITQKLNRRKPYLKENRSPTQEESRKLWNDAKKLEKDLKKNHGKKD